IYFISPETLLGPGKGLEGFQNLYLYRGGELRFVARLNPEVDCIGTSSFDTVCSDTAIARMQVTPDGRFAAFVTKSRVTSFDNEGQAMMYRYDAERDRLECLSCSPTGAKPTSRALGSQNGR